MDLHGSEEARALHAEAPAIDLHADALLWARLLGYDLQVRHSPPFPWAWFGGHTDLPRMQDGGVGAQFFGLVSLPHLDPDLGGACHDQIDLLERAAAASGGRLRLARSAADVEAARAQGAVAGLLGIEGAHCLGEDIDALERFARRGVRYLGLLHFTANACGVPAYGLGANANQGLTPFGKDVVERSEELGVVVDLAHINRAGFADACEVARKPLIVSHAAMAGVHDLWRNISDAQLRAVADSGGVVGVIFCPLYLGRDGIGAVIEHLEHMVNVAGEDTPALGSDWDGFIRPTRGLEEASKLPNLTTALLDRGWPRPRIAKLLRGNALRLLREVPPKA